MSIIEHTDTKIKILYGYYKKSNKPKYWSFFLCKDKNYYVWSLTYTFKNQRYHISITKENLSITTMIKKIHQLLLKVENNTIILPIFNNDNEENENNNIEFNLPL
jgi:hypothetical protein